MDIAFYFENAPMSPRRSLIEEFKFTATLIIRITDFVIGILFLTFLYDFRRSLTYKSGDKKAECLEYLNLLEGLTWMIFASDIAFGNVMDIVLFRGPMKKQQLLFNIGVAVVGAMAGLQSDYSKCYAFFSPQDQRPAINRFLLYVTVVHVAPIMAIVVWLLFLNHARWIEGEPFSLEVRYWSLLTNGSTVTVVNTNPRVLPSLTLFKGPPSECAICYEMVKSDEEIRELQCPHVYHKECLDTWLLLRENNGCPICRTIV